MSGMFPASESLMAAAKFPYVASAWFCWSFGVSATKPASWI